MNFFRFRNEKPVLDTLIGKGGEKWATSTEKASKRMPTSD